MASMAWTQAAPLQFIRRNRGIAYPLAAMLLIIVILVPLPTWLMDLLLVSNITASAVVLLTVMYMSKPLEFASFPSLLLSLTLLRLVLNTATTRLILTNAQQGTAAAGHVVEQFGLFVASGSLAVGVIIFLIIVIIQFVVITKGATRIAEVAARFTLDGMPGKQMAIDADLNAGLIGEEEARRRREEIGREADFFGAMDGASKFVRGDAIAGLIITFINVLGGIFVGMVQLGQPLMWCLETFTKLTIGDGLVSQIPAFIVSISAGMIITRNGGEESLGEELFTQLTARPMALVLTGGFLGLLVLTPLPSMPLLLMGSGCVGLALALNRTRRDADREATRRAETKAREPEKPEKLMAVDPMGLEVGYGLIRLVDRKQGGDLLDRISNLRRQMALDLGIVVPPIRIRDNIQLEPNQYLVRIKGNPVASGEVLPGNLLAIDSGMVSDPVGGIETTEPAFGLPAVWIGESERHMAELRHYTVVEASSVIATHLTELIRQHAAELLTRQEVNKLLDTLKERAPQLVAEVIPDVLKVGDVQKVLQNMLRERVPVRDIETILETLGDWAPRTKDVDVLGEYVRNALARTICQQYRVEAGERGRAPKIHCVTLDPKLEDAINGHLERGERSSVLTMPPALQNQIIGAVRQQVEQGARLSGGVTPVVLCSPQIRLWVRRMIEVALPQVAVLAYNEIVRGIEVVSHGMVVLNHEPANV